MSHLVSFFKQKPFFLLVPVLVISLGLTIWFFGRNNITSLGADVMSETTALVSRDILGKPPEELKTLNVLLLGYGGAGHQGGYLTDVIQVVHFNFETKEIAFISVPRDLWVKLPNGKQAKINNAFTLGEDPNQKIESGGQVAKDMASIVTGLPIDYFIAVDFVGFQRLIGNNLDGLEVTVPETLEDPWYPIKGEELNTCGKSAEEVAQLTNSYSGFELEKQFPCRYEHLLFEKGLVKMEGGEALKYVRSRHGSGSGDFSRSQRQMALLKAIGKKLLSLDALNKAPQFFSDASQEVTTDLDLKAVEYLVPALQTVTAASPTEVVISTENVLAGSKSSTGQSILIPKVGQNQWSAVHGYIEQQLSQSTN